MAHPSGSGDLQASGGRGVGPQLGGAANYHHQGPYQQQPAPPAGYSFSYTPSAAAAPGASRSYHFPPHPYWNSAYNASSYYQTASFQPHQQYGNQLQQTATYGSQAHPQNIYQGYEQLNSSTVPGQGYQDTYQAPQVSYQNSSDSYYSTQEAGQAQPAAYPAQAYHSQPSWQRHDQSNSNASYSQAWFNFVADQSCHYDNNFQGQPGQLGGLGQPVNPAHLHTASFFQPQQDHAGRLQTNRRKEPSYPQNLSEHKHKRSKRKQQQRTKKNKNQRNQHGSSQPRVSGFHQSRELRADESVTTVAPASNDQDDDTESDPEWKEFKADVLGSLPQAIPSSSRARDYSRVVQSHLASIPSIHNNFPKVTVEELSQSHPSVGLTPHLAEEPSHSSSSLIASSPTVQQPQQPPTPKSTLRNAVKYYQTNICTLPGEQLATEVVLQDPSTGSAEVPDILDSSPTEVASPANSLKPEVSPSKASPRSNGVDPGEQNATPESNTVLGSPIEPIPTVVASIPPRENALSNTVPETDPRPLSPCAPTSSTADSTIDELLGSFSVEDPVSVNATVVESPLLNDLNANAVYEAVPVRSPEALDIDLGSDHPKLADAISKAPPFDSPIIEDHVDEPMVGPEPVDTQTDNMTDKGKRKASEEPQSPPAAKRPKDEQSAEPEAPKPAPKIPAIPFPEKPAVIEERNGEIAFHVVNNDGKPLSHIILTHLKCIFQKQLPKMPKDYIARLVYDRTHLSIAIVKQQPLEVVGGITFRPFNDREFAEIVFCAISSDQQVKGYGAHLMAHLKDYVKATSKVMHFLTYADNYAIGYFKKQGFTKEITLDKSVWMGYIKDYEGGTIMQCTMLPRVRYLETGRMLLKQKECTQAKVRAFSKSHVVHQPPKQWKNGVKPIDPMTIEAIKNSGWSPEMDELARQPRRGVNYNQLLHLLNAMQNHNSAWPFLAPVNRDEVQDYYDVIKEPMDLSTMEQKLELDQYPNPEDFLKDAMLIFKNCRSYNSEGTPYTKMANKLEKFMWQKVREIPEWSHLEEELATTKK